MRKIRNIGSNFLVLGIINTLLTLKERWSKENGPRHVNDLEAQP